MTFDRERRKIYHARLMYARPFINSLEFARNGSQISGEAQLDEMPRLLDMLKNSQGILSYTVQGGMDKQDTHFLDISVAGQCQLICQRCLNVLDYAVRIDTRLMLRDQSDLDTLGDHDAGDEEEEFDSILAETHLNVLDMLEDEILLNLPIAPKHEIGVCHAAGRENRLEELHPFAVLVKLKSN